MFVVGEITDDHVFKIESATCCNETDGFRAGRHVWQFSETIMEDRDDNGHADVEYQTAKI